MTKKETKRRKLSKYKNCFCVSCCEELILSLENRRGEKNIECSSCKESFPIEDAEEFNNNLSDIIKGDCPNCDTTILFNAKARIPESKIKCFKCEGLFYIEESSNLIRSSGDTVINCNFCNSPMRIDSRALIQKTQALPKFECLSCGRVFQKEGIKASNIGGMSEEMVDVASLEGYKRDKGSSISPAMTIILIVATATLVLFILNELSGFFGWGL